MRRFLSQLEPLLTAMLVLAGEMGLLKLGTVSLDGSKMKANVSKHKAHRGARPRTLRKRQRAVEPALERLEALPDELGAVEILLTDNGYFSEANVEAGIEPLMALGREAHHR